MTKEELLRSFEERVETRIPLRLALDDGELIFTPTRIYFIAVRLGQWTAVEEWERHLVTRWTMQDSFMGQELAIFTPDGRYLFRKVPPEVNWAELFSGARQFGAKSDSQPAREQEYQVSREEEAEPYSYQESASEMMDMLSKHVAQLDSEQPQDLKSLFEQRRNRQKQQAAPRVEHKPLEKKVDLPDLPEQKKKSGCAGCFKVIFWFVFISIFFSGFLTSFLNSL